MKILSLKRYCSAAIMHFVIFVCICLPLFLFGLIKNEETVWGIMAFAILFIGAMFLLPAIYNVAMYLIYKKKCSAQAPKEGVVANWSMGFFKHMGSVSVKEGDEEYSTSAIFGREEARSMVGKTVSYAVMDEILFIYEVKEELS